MAGQSAAFGLLFVWLEWTKAARASQWSGMGTEEFTYSVVAWCAYAACVLLSATILGQPLLRFRRVPVPALASGSTALGALVVWATLSVHREVYPTAEDALVAALVLGMAVAHLTALGPLVSGGALLCALSALWAVSHFLIFDAGRELWASAAPLGWAGACGGLLALCAWRFRKTVMVGTAALVAAPLCAYALAVHQPWRGDTDTRPNLVFVVADTLRADYLGSYGGHVPTPELDALAAEGARFHHSYSLSPWTMPSMAGMFASEYPAGFTPNGSRDLWLRQTWSYVKGEHPPTIAEMLRDEGYATGAFVANALVWSMPNVMAGFEQAAFSHPIMLAPAGWSASLPFLHAALEAWFPGAGWRRPRDTTQAMNRYAEAWLERHRRGPFLLYVHYIDPHAPYDPPERYRAQQGPWPFFYPYPGGEAFGQTPFDHRYHVEEAHREYVKHLYEGEVRYVDDFAGRLLGTLDALGLRENTFVCFTSDHGEELWDHGEFGHAHTVYNELMRVPLIFRGPGVAPRAFDAKVSGIDVMPTLFGLMGLPPQPQWRGQSLAPALRGEGDIAEVPVFGQATNDRRHPYPLQMAIDGRYKVIREDGTGALWLYDLQVDPGELRDIAAEQPETTASMRALIAEWMASFEYALPDDGAADLESETIEQLRGMGYL
jgi:arylsulfatase A-like enzyme